MIIRMFFSSVNRSPSVGGKELLGFDRSSIANTLNPAISDGELLRNLVISVLISEWANGGDLLDYIRDNYKTLKIKDKSTIDHCGYRKAGRSGK